MTEDKQQVRGVDQASLDDMERQPGRHARPGDARR